MDRKILHVDMNNFYASVELLHRPDLRKQPVIVGGDEEQRRGIVLAKNDIAKAKGIKTAETIFQARQKCPQLIVLPPHREWYHEFSLRARDIYLQYSKKMESFGPDEAWIDVTELPTSGLEVAQEIQNRIREELSLSVSIGVSWNKIFAKMGSDYKKPNAITEITKENFKNLLWPKPVEEFLFVGAATATKLERLGITTIGELAIYDTGLLFRELGNTGVVLQQNARGENSQEVVHIDEQGPAKSLAVMRTSDHDLNTLDEIRTFFRGIAVELANRAAAEGIRGKTLRIQVKDNEFVSKTRQRTFSYGLNEANELWEASLELFDEHFSDKRGIRLLGITLDQLEFPAQDTQLSLFDLLKQEELEGERAFKEEDGILQSEGELVEKAAGEGAEKVAGEGAEKLGTNASTDEGIERAGLSAEAFGETNEASIEAEAEVVESVEALEASDATDEQIGRTGLSAEVKAEPVGARDELAAMSDATDGTSADVVEISDEIVATNSIDKLLEEMQKRFGAKQIKKGFKNDKSE